MGKKVTKNTYVVSIRRGKMEFQNLREKSVGIRAECSGHFDEVGDKCEEQREGDR